MKLPVLLTACLQACLYLAHGQNTAQPKLDDTLTATKTPPIVFPKKTTTSAEFTAERERWAKRVFLPLIRAELGDKATEPKVAEIIEQLVTWWATFDHERISSVGQLSQMWWEWRAESLGREVKPLAEKAAALITENEQMPVLQFFIWAALDAAGMRPDALARAATAGEAFASSKSAPLLGAALAISRIVSHMGEPEVSEALLLELLPLALSKKNLPSDDVPFAVDLLAVRVHSSELSRQGEKLVALYKKSELPEWARLTLAGLAETYSVRALSPKHPVAAQHYKAASELLAAAWKANPQRPEAAAGMIKIAWTGNAAKNEGTRLWFDRATAARCDYLMAYTAMIEALDPKFGGDYLKLLAFGVACARTERYDTKIPEILPICVSTIAQQLPDWRPMLRQEEISRRLVTTLNKRIEQTPDGELKRHYRGLAFLMGWMAGDFKSAAENLATMENPTTKFYAWPNPTNHMMVNLQLDPTRILIESLSLGSDGPKILPAHTAWEKGEFAKALELAEGAMKDTLNSRDWPRILIQDSTFALGFKKGEWTPLPTATGAWYKGGKGGEYPQSNVLAMATRGPTWTSRRLRSELGSKFEVRGEVRLPKLDAPGSFTFSLGIPDEFCAVMNPDWLVLAVSKKSGGKSEVYVTTRLAGLGAPGKPGPDLGEVVKFRLMRNDDEISWWVNDTAIFEGQKIPKGLPSGRCAFGVGGTTNDGKEPLIFEKLEARKLFDAG